MANTNGKGRSRWLLCTAMCLPVSVSPCFAQGNREAQLITPPPQAATPFPCDSLDPKVCFDIYRHRMEPAPMLSDHQADSGERCLMFTAPNPFGYLKPHVCSSRLTRIRDLCETKRGECR
jgi:hypothetical protein